MEAKRPMELKGALALVKYKHVRTEIAVAQSGFHLEEARRRWGMQANLPTAVAAAVYHLLRPGARANQLRQLEVGKEMVVKDQGIWIPTRLIGCRTTRDAEKRWKCRRRCHKGVRKYERTFKQKQHDWGDIRGDNALLDLNDPKV